MEANFVSQLSIFVLAIFVGYYVVWSVTPALHTPLMAVTNAISSVIIVGAIIAVGPEGMSLSKVLGFCAMVLAAINILVALPSRIVCSLCIKRKIKWGRNNYVVTQ